MLLWKKDKWICLERVVGLKRKKDYFFVVEEIMENGNIQLRDWNTKSIVNETVPPQQLKKIYLDDMKMEDLERNLKWCKITQNDESDNEMTRITETTLTAPLTTCKSTIGPINTSTTSSDDMDFAHTSNTNLLTMNMTTTHEMKFQHVDSMATNMITIQSDIDSLTISLTTPFKQQTTQRNWLHLWLEEMSKHPPKINRLKCLLL